MSWMVGKGKIIDKDDKQEMLYSFISIKAIVRRPQKQPAYIANIRRAILPLGAAE